MEDGQRFWRSPSKGCLEDAEVIRSIASFLEVNGPGNYRVMIGTDSLATIGASVPLVTAVTLWRVGNGGIFFIWRSKPRRYLTLGQRMRAEADQSIGIAAWLRGHLRAMNSALDVDEIHLDVGTNGPTREFTRTLVEHVNGHGYCARCKPHAVVASRVAHQYA